MKKQHSRQRPYSGWRHLDGPLWHGKSSVWEHNSVGRIHTTGIYQDLDGKTVFIHSLDHRSEWMAAIAHQPRQTRALMVWAQRLATAQNP